MSLLFKLQEAEAIIKRLKARVAQLEEAAQYRSDLALKSIGYPKCTSLTEYIDAVNRAYETQPKYRTKEQRRLIRNVENSPKMPN